MKSTLQGLGFILAIVAMSIGAALGADPVPPAAQSPIAAFAMGQCNKALALFVVIDADHAVRFSQNQTSTFVRGADGKVTEHVSPPYSIHGCNAPRAVGRDHFACRSALR